MMWLIYVADLLYEGRRISGHLLGTLFCSRFVRQYDCCFVFRLSYNEFHAIYLLYWDWIKHLRVSDTEFSSRNGHDRS
jgi:hypothetical protein